MATCFHEASQIIETTRLRGLSCWCLTTLPSAVTFLFLAAPVLLGQASGGNAALQAASVAERSGRYEEAATLYEQFLASTADSSADPSTLVHARTRLATAYFLLHRYRESLEAVAPLTSNHSRRAGVPAQTWLVDGLDRLELGQLPEAIASLERTLVLNPTSGTARLALGDAFERSGRLEEAAREYEEQTRVTPSFPDAWYKLGLAYARLATQVSDDFTQKVPASAVGQQLAAEDLLATGDDQGAAGALLRLLRQAPAQPQGRADFGAALLELGYTKAAEDQFGLELSQDPDCPLARLGLAETASLRGDWEGAVSIVEQAARSNARELARLLEFPPPGPLREAWRQSKVRLPPRLFESPAGKLWKSWLGNSDSLSMPARADAGHSCSSPSSKAISTPGLWLTEACYQQLRVSLRSEKALSLEERVKLAEAEFRLGGYQAARRQAKQVLESNPRNEWGVYWLSKSYDEMAQVCFSKASLNPESARVHQILGDYYARRHNLPHAKAEYVAAIQLAPDLPDLHLGLGTVCWANGEWTEAEKELERTLELAPGSAVAQYELGDTYVQERRWQSAIDHLRRIADDPAVGVKARLDLATAEAEMGQVRRAIEELLPVAEKDRDGEIHYRLATLHRKLGEKDQAQEALATFKRLQNASPKVDRRELEALDSAAQSSARDHDR